MIAIVFLAILAITVSVLLSYFIVTPLMFYVLDTILYLVAKFIKSSWAMEAFTLYDNRYNRTINGHSRVYIPNPLKYILYTFKNIKNLQRNEVSDRESDILGENILNMPVNPLIKNTKSSPFNFVHKRIISKGKEGSNHD